MRINNITIENFQGIKSVHFEFNGADAEICGDNATGKTTIYNALTWLLFDKPSTGAANFNPKPKNADGGDVHNLESVVEADFDVCGTSFTLKKVFKEKWTQKRGETTTEMSGHTTEYYIDTVPSKEREYNDYISDMIPQDKAKILMSPLHFAEVMPWQERRKILFEMNGNVTDDDVIDAHPNLEPLKSMLGNHTMEQFQKISQGKLKEINTELHVLPARIDEAQKAVPDLTGVMQSDVLAQKEQLETERAELEQSLVSMGDAEAEANARAHIAELEARWNEAKNTYMAAIQSENQAYYDKISAIDAEISNETNVGHELTASLKQLISDADKMLAGRGTQLILYDRAKAESWNGETVCPTCNRPLDDDDINKAKDMFEQEKKARMQSYVNHVKEHCSKESEADLRARAAKVEASILEQRALFLSLQEKKKAIKDKVKPANFELTEQSVSLMKSICDARTHLHDIGLAHVSANERVDGKIQVIKAKIAECSNTLAQFITKEEQEKRVASLMVREKELAKAFEDLQHGLSLCEDFIRAKSEMISNGICAKFKNVRFALFQNQINGGLKEVCDVLVPSDNGALVPFAFANNAARINAGIEIIDVLSEHWGVSMPLFVDNAESITVLAKTRTQVVSLVVSELDKVLRCTTN